VDDFTPAVLDRGSTDLETAVLDALDKADDGTDATSGTLALTTARRRRSMGEVLGLIVTVVDRPLGTRMGAGVLGSTSAWPRCPEAQPLSQACRREPPARLPKKSKASSEVRGR
jgi:hypothetical protein